jgi:phosphatidylserine/phosphatidylglycerophosphate/cardiolipin synthase-like enzyme
VYENSTAPIRLALFETLVNRGLRGENRTKTIARMNNLRRLPQNTFAVGSLIKRNALDGWMLEKLSGLTTHVNYVHNKCMIIDPLSADPIVINGSANFSEASTRRNDENILVVRGDLRAADVFFTEFIRMHRHHAWRESQQWRNRARRRARRVVEAVRRPQEIPAIVRGGGEQWLAEPGDPKWPWWPDYFTDFANSARRSYYANPHVQP